MKNGQVVLLKSRIARSAFSGERIFRIDLADGTEYAGVAPVDYCLRDDQKPLLVGDPSPDEMIDGLIEARVVTNGGQVAAVTTPDGEIVRVKLGEIGFEVSSEARYVPVGP